MATRKRKDPKQGQFAYDGLDRVLHEKARLGILTALSTRPRGLRFTELKELCALTDGNLSRHVQVLYEADLVEVFKGHENRRPQTLVRLTVPGRKAFLAYIAELERVVEHAREAGRATSKTFDVPPGFAPA